MRLNAANDAGGRGTILDSTTFGARSGGRNSSWMCRSGDPHSKIAPVLLELWLHKNREFGLLSGVEFTKDETQGLNGVRDYIITLSTRFNACLRSE